MNITYVKDKNKLENPEVQHVMDALEELKKPREFSPEYNSMMQKHQVEWKRIAEDAGPWEWSWGLDALIEHIRWMRDYYKLGENVWGQEDKEWKKEVKYTRLETLEKAIYYYDKWMNIEEEYIQVVEKPGTYTEHDNGDGTVTIDNLGFDCIYKYGPRNNKRKAMKITYRKLHKAEQKYKKLFFKTVYKYMESWWD